MPLSVILGPRVCVLSRARPSPPEKGTVVFRKKIGSRGEANVQRGCSPQTALPHAGCRPTPTQDSQTGNAYLQVQVLNLQIP